MATVEEFRPLANPVLTLQVASTADQGTSHGYSTEDFRTIVEEFGKVKGRIPLAMSGAEARNFMGQPDGAPALGWLKSLWLDGTRLMGTFEDIPKSLLPKFDFVTIRPEIREGRLVRVIVSGLGLPRPRSAEGFSVALHSDATVKMYSEDDDHGDLMSVDRLTRTRMARTGEAYGDAVRETLADFPEVARGYLCRRGK